MESLLQRVEPLDLGLLEFVTSQVLQMEVFRRLTVRTAPRLGRALRYYRGRVRAAVVDCRALNVQLDNSAAMELADSFSLSDIPQVWVCQPRHHAFFYALSQTDRAMGAERAVLHCMDSAHHWIHATSRPADQPTSRYFSWFVAGSPCDVVATKGVVHEEEIGLGFDAGSVQRLGSA